MAQEKQFQRECQAAYFMVKEDLTDKLASIDELALALQQAGRNPTRKTLMKYWSNGGVSFDQFCLILKELNQPSVEQLQNAFRKLDRNRDGHISFDELKAMLLKKDSTLTDAELRGIFSDADINKDGKIDYKEFVRLMSDTMEESKRQALTRLEKRERRDARQKKRERREQALNGSVAHGQSASGPGTHKQQDQLSVSSNGSESGSTHLITEKASQMSISLRGSSTADEQFKYHLKRKGCFLYDADSDDDGGRVDIVSHQYRINLKERCNLWATISPAGNPDLRGSDTVDTMLVIVDINGHVCGFTEEKNNVTFSVHAELPAGDYILIPFTTGCRFHPRPPDAGGTKAKAELLSKNKEGLMKLTKEFRMILMNIFDACDLDDNGTLSREEFNIYNVRTGDEHVTDEEWKVVQGNFDKKHGEITIKGFLDLHQLEADDSGGDTEDMWISLRAMGYNDRLQLDEACPFLIEIHSDQPVAYLEVTEIQPISQNAWENFAKYMLTKSSPQPSRKQNLALYSYGNDSWAALVVENKASETVHAALSLNGSKNYSMSPIDVIQRELIFRASSTSILCFLLRSDETKELKIQAELTDI